VASAVEGLGILPVAQVLLSWPVGEVLAGLFSALAFGLQGRLARLLAEQAALLGLDLPVGVGAGYRSGPGQVAVEGVAVAAAAAGP
jgi:hypothetical protein